RPPAPVVRVSALDRRARVTAPGDCSVDQEQDYRPHDRGQPAAQIPELVHRVGAEQRGGEEAAEDCADDPDPTRDDEPARVVPRQPHLGYRPSDGTKDDERDDSHGTSRFGYHLRTEKPGLRIRATAGVKIGPKRLESSDLEPRRDDGRAL